MTMLIDTKVDQPSRFGWRDFYAFLEERMQIWYKKEILKELPPWTDDPALRNGKFTNIYRELDRGTRYELKNIITPHLSQEEQLYRICLYRNTNAPRTFECLLAGGKEKHLKELRYSAPSREFISDALMYTVPKDWGRIGWVLHYQQELEKEMSKGLYDRILRAESPNDVLFELQKLPRIGPFMAYEMYTSLTYTNWFPWSEDDLLVIGPGAYPGIQILIRKWTKKEFPVQDAHMFIWSKAKEVREELKCHGDFIFIPLEYQPPMGLKYQDKFTRRTFEHAICEFRKWWWITYKKKRIRRKYDYQGRLELL